MLITVIIPVRIKGSLLYDEIDRIRRIVDCIPTAYYRASIVDAGSDLEYSEEMQKIAESRAHVTCTRLDNSEEVFSIGVARDVGASKATTPLILFHDIDLIASGHTYERIALEAIARDMKRKCFNFFAIPAVYLSARASQAYLKMLVGEEPAIADFYVHDAITMGAPGVVDSLTYASSAIVVNRHIYLSIGGHNRSFFGHGGEDFDLMHRLTHLSPRGVRPKNYYQNTGSNQILNYHGFRSYFALYGIDVFQRGILLSHLWHERRVGGGYVRPGNKNYISDTMKKFDADLINPVPLPDHNIAEKTLVLCRPETSTAECLRQAIPLLGEVHWLSLSDAERSVDNMAEFVRSKGLTQAVIWNTHATANRLNLANILKECGLKVFNFERGALPDSWFFDPNGFLYDSKSYQPACWDVPLGPVEALRTREYLFSFKNSDSTLEKNGPRRTAAFLRQSMGLGSQKVLFVALQRPNDTVIKYYSGPCGSAAGFTLWLRELAMALDPKEYVLLIKKHPLEQQADPIPNAIFVDPETNIKDLVELSDKVITINSGVGVLALAFNKPLIVAGDAFYAHEGLAHRATSSSELLRLACSNLSSDPDKCERFMKYLIEDFYSFGAPLTRLRDNGNGTFDTITESIVFRSIRGLTPEPIELCVERSSVGSRSTLFNTFIDHPMSAKIEKAPNTAKPKVPNAPEVKCSPPKSIDDKNKAKLIDDKAKAKSTRREFAKGCELFHQGCFKDALTHYDLCVRNEPGNARYLRCCAECCVRLGLRAKAISYLEIASKLIPTNKAVRRRLLGLRMPMLRILTGQVVYKVPIGAPGDE